MERGEGCTLVDCDGHRYLDFLNNYTALVLGHAHPAVTAAATEQMARGAIFGAPSAAQYQLAELICQRVPGVDYLRYTNSGTEATMMAMRAARAYSGKQIILKMDGGYHGSHDFAEVNITPDPNPHGQPTPLPEQGGVPHAVLGGTMVARFNDLASVEAALEEHHDRIAGLIVEPLQNSAGMIVAQPGFLAGLRQLADKYQVLLIFDEVVTFRLHEGGMQKMTGIIPDLTALGKSIGGGYAIGAFGGEAEIMRRYDPAFPRGFHHSGTFNGHNVAMAAGAATLRHFGPAEIAHIDALGDRLRAGFAPYTLSTDLTTLTHGKADRLSLSLVMSEFMALGFSLSEVIRRVTGNPARALGESATRGSLREGMLADLTLFHVRAGDYTFSDGRAGHTQKGAALIVPEMVIKAGVIMPTDGIDPNWAPLTPHPG